VRVAILRRISGACGIASQLVGLAFILAAVASSPWFSWTENDLSILGVEGSVTAIFNWGLILTGLLSLVFAIGLWKSLIASRPGQVGTVCLLLGSVALSTTGIFPRTINMPHDSASIAFFVFITLALFLVGVAAIAASQTLWGVLSLAASVLMVGFLLAPWPWSGGSIEQLLSCLPWSLWTVVFGLRLLVGTRQVNV